MTVQSSNAGSGPASVSITCRKQTQKVPFYDLQDKLR
jgi:hypothetical protein